MENYTFVTNISVRNIDNTVEATNVIALVQSLTN